MPQTMPNLHTPELTPELYDQIHEYAYGDKPIGNTTACEWLRALLAKVERPKPVVQLQTGYKVKHPKYGTGEVLSVGRMTARVDFNGIVILLSITQLEREEPNHE